jgi:serine/threonine protein phosphatase PrpC
MQFKHAIVQNQGNRGYMEDYHCLYANLPNDGIFGGVYDGHGGSFAADFAHARLHMEFWGFLKEGCSPALAFEKSYQEITNYLHSKVNLKDLAKKRGLKKSVVTSDPSQMDSGTTAANFYIVDNAIHFANAGDSEIMVISENPKDDDFTLTTLHEPSNAGEITRIRKDFGEEVEMDRVSIIKDNYYLRMTRALGDKKFKSAGVIPTPSTGQFKMLDSNKWIICGTDGLFAHIEKYVIGEIVREQKTAKKIANHLLKNIEIDDNVTIMVLEKV